MAYAQNAGRKVLTSGTVAGDGAVTTHVSAIAAGANVTLTSASDVITIAAPTGAGNTLDGSYDAGGAGAGRTVTVDNGGVLLNNVGAEGTGVLQIVTNSAATIPLVIKKDTDIVLSMASFTQGSIVGLKGPIQTKHAVESQVKNTDPTAFDLQNEFQDPSFTVKGLHAALLGGKENAIGATQNETQSADVGNGSAVGHSTRASQAVIVGGNQNEIFNTITAMETNNVGIFGGFRNKIHDNPTQRAAVGFDTINANSVALGGTVATIQNAAGSATIGGIDSTIQDHLQSAIIVGNTNLIKCHNDSDGPGRSNAIIASDGATMTLDLANAIASDETANFGCNNVVIASTGAVIDEDPKSCLLVGTNPKATVTSGKRDVSCIIVGGGKANGGTTDTSAGSTMINAHALVGVSYSTTGTSGAGQILVDNGVITTGADFAESFEWNDGNPDEEDRVGLFVKLSLNELGLPNGKIEVGGEKTIGPVSAAPGFLSNATPMKWKGKFLRDDFDREIKDSEGNPTLNPNYDDSYDYTSRSSRKEWSPIGMIGRLRVRASSNIGIYRA